MNIGKTIVKPKIERVDNVSGIKKVSVQEYRPFMNNILLKPLASELTDSGLLLPDNVNAMTLDPRFLVVATGKDCQHVKPGDTVFINFNAHFNAGEMVFNEGIFIQLNENAIQGFHMTSGITISSLASIGFKHDKHKDVFKNEELKLILEDKDGRITIRNYNKKVVCAGNFKNVGFLNYVLQNSLDGNQ